VAFVREVCHCLCAFVRTVGFHRKELVGQFVINHSNDGFWSIYVDKQNGNICFLVTSVSLFLVVINILDLQYQPESGY
jgi:hypothetical protein